MDRPFKQESSSFFGIPMPRRSARRPKPGPFVEATDEDDINFDAHFHPTTNNDNDHHHSLFLTQPEEESDFFAVDPERTRRTELQERSNLRERVNYNLARENSFDELPVPPPPRRVAPARDFSWTSAFSDHHVAHQQPTAATATAAAPAVLATTGTSSPPTVPSNSHGKPKTKPSNHACSGSGFWEDFLETKSSPRKGVRTKGDADEKQTSVKDKTTGEENVTVVSSAKTQNSASSEEDDDNDSYDPYRVGKNDESDDPSSSSEEVLEDKNHDDSAKKMKNASSGKSVDMARYLESNSWFAQGEVVVVSSSRSIISSEQPVGAPGPTGDGKPTEQPTRQRRRRIRTDNDLSSVCFDDIKNSENRENEHETSASSAPKTQPKRRIVARRCSASSIDWNSLLMTTNSAPKAAAENDDDRRSKHIRSSEKTKKDETIARASIVSSTRGVLPQRRPNKKAIKGRGRRAVEAWRREQRAEKRKEKKKEEMQYAFNLEFDPFVLKPVDFTSNVFRAPGSPKKNLFGHPDPVKMASLVKDEPPKTSQEKHGQQLERNEGWHKDMTDLFAVLPEQHRKNRVSRASF